MEDTAILSQYPKLAAACRESGGNFPYLLASRHVRIAQELESTWGMREGKSLLDDLIFSDRPDRLGFSFDVLRELFSLNETYDACHPELTGSPNDPFSVATADTARADIEQRRKNAGKKREEPQARHPVQDVFVSERAESAPAVAARPAPDRIANLAPWPELSRLDELHAVMARRGSGERVPPRDTRHMLEILKQYVALADKDIESALKIQKQLGKKQGPIGKVLVSMGVVDAESIIRVLCLQYGVMMVNLKRFQIPPDAIKLISSDLARKYRAVPVAMQDGQLFLAVENPFGFEQREYFGFLTKLKVELVMAPASQISHRLVEYGQIHSVRQGDQEFRSLAKQALSEGPDAIAGSEAEDFDESTVSQNDATIVGLVNKIISDAAEVGASDIHIESFPGESQARIRFRRDGRMEEYSQYSASYHRAVVSRIKIMSSLNIAERRLPQDGKITFQRKGMPRLDLRVVTIPTVRNIENITLRLLHTGDPIPLGRLGMGERDTEVFRRLVMKPYGLLLVCGPTGSGKTTTLHSALRELNRPESKIWTAEDPIEIVQKNICQVQMNAQIGWTFAAALRSFLRADPDVIMVGEMRDLETAGIALEASMTGHLVLSTLHTNSASETTARLLDLGIDPFNLSDALIGVLAQRLPRSLCRHCAQKQEMSPIEAEEIAAEYYFSAHQCQPSKIEKEAIVEDWRQRLCNGEAIAKWTPEGCPQCSMEGYRGRLAVFELLEVTPQIRQLVAHRSPATELQRVAVGQGMRTLKQDGIEKTLLGLTDLAQVRAACS